MENEIIFNKISNKQVRETLGIPSSPAEGVYHQDFATKAEQLRIVTVQQNPSLFLTLVSVIKTLIFT